MASEVVRSQGGTPTVCGTVAAARQTTEARRFDLVLLDNQLPDGKGYDLFAHLAARDPEGPVVMITGVPDLTEAVALTRNGLFDYLTKPVSADALTACLQRALKRLRAAAASGAPAEWFGESAPMRAVLEQLRQAARHRSTTVLLVGETGTGKEVAARQLHRLTYADREAPFVAVNCAALPADMFEAELFGAERGAYTGADKRRAGLAAAAAGGTLFLDEIGEVPLPLQAKLLRLIEAREFRPLGSTRAERFDGRFVAATNRSLAEEVQAGRFREDLLYRLDVFTVELPPLRQRRADILALAEHWLSRLARHYERTCPLLKPEDAQALQAYDYPGNVRELRNILERGLLRTPEDQRWLTIDPAWLQRAGAASAPEPPPAAAAIPPPPDRQLTPIEAEEYRLIGQALRECHGGIRRAASRLGLSPQALLRRLEKWPELRQGGP